MAWHSSIFLARRPSLLSSFLDSLFSHPLYLISLSLARWREVARITVTGRVTPAGGGSPRAPIGIGASGGKALANGGTCSGEHQQAMHPWPELLPWRWISARALGHNPSPSTSRCGGRWPNPTAWDRILAAESPSLVLDSWWNPGNNHCAKCVDMKWYVPCQVVELDDDHGGWWWPKDDLVLHIWKRRKKKTKMGSRQRYMWKPKFGFGN
jgi:hypothetical protein